MSMMTPDFSTIEPRFSGKVKRYSGAAVGDVNPDETATGLLALADGLGIHVLSSALDAAAAQAARDAQLTSVFGDRRQPWPGWFRRD